MLLLEAALIRLVFLAVEVLKAGSLAKSKELVVDEAILDGCCRACRCLLIFFLCKNPRSVVSCLLTRQNQCVQSSASHAIMISLCFCANKMSSQLGRNNARNHAVDTQRTPCL